MFTLDGLSRIKKVKWKDITPGCIILGGIDINGSVISELISFPVLTDRLIYQLLSKYMFLENRYVVVADALYNYNPGKLSEEIRDSQKSLLNINSLRDNYQESRRMILKDIDEFIPEDKKIIDTSLINREYFKKDNYNSFSYMYGLDSDLNSLPSFFHKADLKLSIGDLLTNRLNEKFNLPDDNDVMIHLVIDFSKSMDTGGKLDLAIKAVNDFYNYYSKLLKNSRINIYVFSDNCRKVDFPLCNIKMPRKDTSYSSFIKKVLHYRDRDTRNNVILLTDGLPSDYKDALKFGELIKKNGLDYTQIIFQVREELRTEVEYNSDTLNTVVIDNIITDTVDDSLVKTLNDKELDNKIVGIYNDFSKIAEVCGGNQIVLKINEIIGVVTVECYDRYLGVLSLLNRT